MIYYYKFKIKNYRNEYVVNYSNKSLQKVVYYLLRARSFAQKHKNMKRSYNKNGLILLNLYFVSWPHCHLNLQFLFILFLKNNDDNILKSETQQINHMNNNV